MIVPFVTRFVHGADEAATFEPNEEIAAGAKTMLDELSGSRRCCGPWAPAERGVYRAHRW